MTRMQGLLTLDGEQLPDQLTPTQHEAQRFLWVIAGVGKNTLRNIDISDMDIPAQLFFYVLAALQVLAHSF